MWLLGAGKGEEEASLTEEEHVCFLLRLEVTLLFHLIPPSTHPMRGERSWGVRGFLPFLGRGRMAPSPLQGNPVSEIWVKADPGRREQTL